MGKKHSVYCYSYIYRCEKVDALYLFSLEQEYYKWICDKFSIVLRLADSTFENIMNQLEDEEEAPARQAFCFSFLNRGQNLNVYS